MKVLLTRTESGTDVVLSASSTLTIPGQTVKATLRLDGDVIAEQDVVISGTEATTVSATVPSADVSPGAIFEAELFLGDASLLSGQVALP